MKLTLDKNLKCLSDDLFKQPDIPCRVIVGEDFTITFNDGCKIIANVQDWDLDKMQLIYPMRAGGNYFLFEQAMITLDKINTYTYDIKQLKFFSSLVGWNTIFENGHYVSVIDKFTD